VPVRFDDSLPILASVVAEQLGEEGLSSGVALRDTTGRLAFFLRRPIDNRTFKKLSEQLLAALGPYARADRILAGPNDLGTAGVLSDPSLLTVSLESHVVHLLDRRLVGADWLRPPEAAAPPPPRFVFASLKGGVGRSTALSVAAADIASRGRRVLAIDLDMEAPGLGAMLLDEATLPEFGLIDALVEEKLSGLDEAFLADLVGPSALADRRGRIDVIPAFGRRSLRYPGDVLAKIARAYNEQVGKDGKVATILDQMQTLVGRFADPKRYDAILVDSRAGLHETTASAILGLGADIFLFGLDERQTFQGYGALLAHLARFLRPADPAPEWLERLTMVQGRAPVDAESRAVFAENCRMLFERTGLVARRPATAPSIMLPASPFKDVPWDDDTRDEDLHIDDSSEPREPVAILEDERFHLFQPTRQHDLLSESVYTSSFGMFLDRIRDAFLTDQEVGS
jgi:CobQ/CobB/MinD/ParA nucleotide binding domain